MNDPECRDLRQYCQVLRQLEERTAREVVEERPEGTRPGSVAMLGLGGPTKLVRDRLGLEDPKLHAAHAQARIVADNQWSCFVKVRRDERDLTPAGRLGGRYLLRKAAPVTAQNSDTDTTLVNQ